MAKQDSKGTKTPISIYLLPREGPLILPFSIINRNKPIFYNCYNNVGLDAGLDGNT